MLVVAETTPLLDWSGPLSVEMVRPPLKTLLLVNVLDEYSFGIVVEESTKWMALVVDHARPAAVKKVADEVEKKLRVSFQASAEVVDHARPTLVKYEADEVEKEFAK